MSVDLREMARKVGEAVQHNATEHAWRERTPEHCAGCRAEAAALVELRALREACAKRIERVTPMLADEIRALGEPEEAR